MRVGGSCAMLFSFCFFCFLMIGDCLWEEPEILRKRVLSKDTNSQLLKAPSSHEAAILASGEPRRTCRFSVARWKKVRAG